jgi:RNA polymerase sigma-70 factor (ECF subfamily)
VKLSTAAIEELIKLYGGRVLRLARNIIRNHECAEEVVQNAFVKALGNLAAFRGDSRFCTWLVRITVNEALMKVRKRRWKEVSIDDDTEEKRIAPRQLKDSSADPEERYSQEELRGLLERTIGDLRPAYRIVFQLCEVEGFTTQEAAQTLDLSVSAVRTRLQRARLRLRHLLTVYSGPKKTTQYPGQLTEPCSAV